MKNVYNMFKNVLGYGQGNERSNLAKKNIGASFIIKGLNIGITLLLIPVIINYLKPTTYGIWIALSSIIGWFGFFDIGLGHGLRNRLAEALATGKKELARIYVSTTYAILSIIISVVLILFYVTNPYLNWNKILNVGNEVTLEGELSVLALLVFTFFCIQFVMKLITTILTADQRQAKVGVVDLISRALSLFIILILVETTEASILYLGVIMSFVPLVVLVVCSIWYYNGKYKSLRPSWKYIDFTKAKDLFSLGIKFFVIQISSILLYQTNTIIITQLFGPEKVTSYSVTFQYFSVLMMFSSIILTPFWSAFTEAWTKNELEWIEKIMSKLFRVWVGILFLGIIMLLLSKHIFYIWIGDNVSIPYTMSALVAIWILMNTWISIFSHFLNGIGKLKLQLFVSISGALFNIPLSIYLGMELGVLGVLLANIIVGLAATVIFPIQYRKIISGNANGIWNK